MALFRRKPTTEIPELQEYYESEKRDRPAVAWALALVSLLSTIAIVLLLFFAGRWVYDRIKKDDQTQPAPATTSEPLDQVDESTETPGSDSGDSETTDEPSASTPESTPTPTPTPTTTTPVTGPLPVTGPTEPEL